MKGFVLSGKVEEIFLFLCELNEMFGDGFYDCL